MSGKMYKLQGNTQSKLEKTAPALPLSMMKCKGIEGSILQLAGQFDKTDAMKALLDFVRDKIKTGDRRIFKTIPTVDQTTLYFAVKSGDAEKVAMLLDYVKDFIEDTTPGALRSVLLLPGKNHFTLLQTALVYGYAQVVKTLLQYVIDNLETTDFGSLDFMLTSVYNASYQYSVLIMSSHTKTEYGTTKRVKALLGYILFTLGVSYVASWTIDDDMNADSNLGVTALHETAETSSAEALKFLLDYVKDNLESAAPGTLKDLVVAADNWRGETALHKAAKSGSTSKVLTLLNYVRDNIEASAPGTTKAMLEATDVKNQTVFHFAAWKPELVIALMDFVTDNLLRDDVEFLKKLLTVEKEDCESVVRWSTNYQTSPLVRMILDYGNDASVFPRSSSQT